MVVYLPDVGLCESWILLIDGEAPKSPLNDLNDLVHRVER